MQGGICYECKNKKKHLPYERSRKRHYPSDRYGGCCHCISPAFDQSSKNARLPASGSTGGVYLSMICLYGASTLYHTLNISPVINKRLRKLDHMMIFVLIAGTYTPVCLIVLGDHTGWNLLGLVWGIALVGIIINALWITCPKWFSSLIYIAMGWVCILAISKIIAALPAGGFAWLLAGGIIYTAGGIIYALKLPIFNSRHRYFGSHEIFHLFVMGGSLCHYMMMYQFVA